MANTRKKFKCCYSKGGSIYFGDTITGVLEDERILQVKPLDMTSKDRIRYLESYPDTSYPLYGGLWHWQETD